MKCRQFLKLSRNQNKSKMKVKKQGKIPCSLTELDLGITLKSGQSFRWIAHPLGYRGVFNGCVWTLTQDKDNVSYSVLGSLQDSQDPSTILSDYFRLNISLKEYVDKWALSDPHFQKYVDNVKGVRILHQDVVENLFSFICSSNNNITRISGMVEKLCYLYGKKIGTVDGCVYYDFPTIESLIGDDVESTLRKEGFGYRAGYIAKTAKQLAEFGGRQWLLDLHKDKNIPYLAAREKLTALCGIGPKVADCICLMSLGHLEAIPVDTHIFQVAKETYLPHLQKQKTVTPKIQNEVGNYLRELWGPLAGWTQAIIFCVRINITTMSSEKKRKSKQGADCDEKRTRRR